MNIDVIEKYRKNSTTSEYPANFNHENASNFDSDWEYTKSLSNYHFDMTRPEKEGDYYDVVGHFVGEWQEETANAIKASFPAPCRDRKWPILDGIVPTLQLEKNDEEGWGYDPRHAQSNAVRTRYMMENCPNIIKMVNFFGMEEMTFKFMCQMPGQSFRLHIDKMQHRWPSDIWRVIRLEIALFDWYPGQFWQYGNTFHKQWKRGEVTVFDWVNIPHATGNAGMWPRPFLQLTGLRTDRTDEILAKASRSQEFFI